VTNVVRKKGGVGDGSETIAGYFRRIFEEKPQLLKERSNDELLRRWQEDHPGQEVSRSVKVGLSNIKSVLRSKGRKKARKASSGQQKTEVPAATEVHRPAPARRGIAALEEAIDDCLSMAKATDRDGLAGVIDLLRRARNQVVWKMGEPE
jgi:hypothetical protein